MLAALAALTGGCLGLGGGGNEVTPAPLTETPPTTTRQTGTRSPTRTATETPSPTRTQTQTGQTQTGQTRTGTQTQTPTQTTATSATETETPTPSPTPTPTPRSAQAPPPGSLAVAFDFQIERIDGRPVCVVDASVTNQGSVTFEYVAFRVDVVYEPVGRSARTVGVGYLNKRFDSFGNGTERVGGTVELSSEVDGDESESRFDVRLQYRTVEYTE